jgi:DNA-binding transcriptional LysR family regulator
MDLKTLEVFCRIVELKSFTRAAEAVSLTQPTVSGHIKDLEDELGLRLLDRAGRTGRAPSSTPMPSASLGCGRRRSRRSGSTRAD